jgi:hypothetical protein
MFERCQDELHPHGATVYDCLYGDRYFFTATTIQYQFGEENHTGDIAYHSEWAEADSGELSSCWLVFLDKRYEIRDG